MKGQEWRKTAVCLSDGTIRRHKRLPEETLPRYLFLLHITQRNRKAFRWLESQCKTQWHLCTDLLRAHWKTCYCVEKRQKSKRSIRNSHILHSCAFKLTAWVCYRWRTWQGYIHGSMCSSTSLWSIATLMLGGADSERTQTYGNAPSLFHIS